MAKPKIKWRYSVDAVLEDGRRINLRYFRRMIQAVTWAAELAGHDWFPIIDYRLEISKIDLEAGRTWTIVEVTPNGKT
jgi:hypothetical protein